MNGKSPNRPTQLMLNLGKEWVAYSSLPVHFKINQSSKNRHQTICQGSQETVETWCSVDGVRTLRSLTHTEQNDSRRHFIESFLPNRPTGPINASSGKNNGSCCLRQGHPGEDRQCYLIYSKVAVGRVWSQASLTSCLISLFSLETLSAPQDAVYTFSWDPPKRFV